MNPEIHVHKDKVYADAIWIEFNGLWYVVWPEEKKIHDMPYLEDRIGKELK